VKFVNYTTYTHDQQALTELRPRHVKCTARWAGPDRGRRHVPRRRAAERTGTAVHEFERFV
jgi:hypothetical protein